MIDIGSTCRCLECCCPEGRGHRHPRYQEYLEEQEALAMGEHAELRGRANGKMTEYLEQQAEMNRQQARYPGGQG